MPNTKTSKPADKSAPTKETTAINEASLSQEPVDSKSSPPSDTKKPVDKKQEKSTGKKKSTVHKADANADASKEEAVTDVTGVTDDKVTTATEVAPLGDFTITIVLSIKQISDQDAEKLVEALKPVAASVNDNLLPPSTSTYTIGHTKLVPPPTYLELEEQDFYRKAEQIKKQLTGISNSISVHDVRKHISKSGIDISFAPNTTEMNAYGKPKGGMDVTLFKGDLNIKFYSSVIYDSAVAKVEKK